VIGCPEAQDHVDRRRLARTVRAEEGRDLAELEPQVDPIHRTDRAEAPMNVAELDGNSWARNCLGRRFDPKHVVECTEPAARPQWIAWHAWRSGHALSCAA